MKTALSSFPPLIYTFLLQDLIQRSLSQKLKMIFPDHIFWNWSNLYEIVESCTVAVSSTWFSNYGFSGRYLNNLLAIGLRNVVNKWINYSKHHFELHSWLILWNSILSFTLGLNRIASKVQMKRYHVCFTQEVQNIVFLSNLLCMRSPFPFC